MTDNKALKLIIILTLTEIILLVFAARSGYFKQDPKPSPNCWDNYSTEQEAILHCETHDPIQSIIQDRKLTQTILELKGQVNQTPYVFSGSTPAGWDCSGLVRWTYEQLGMEIPHSADKQAHLGQRVHSPKIGDIVAFALPGRSDFYHSAIYIGQGKIINANKLFKTTVIQPLSDFSKDQIRFIRLGTSS